MQELLVFVCTSILLIKTIAHMSFSPANDQTEQENDLQHKRMFEIDANTHTVFRPVMVS